MFPQRKRCRPRVPQEVAPVREPLVRAPGRPVCTAQGPRRQTPAPDSGPGGEARGPPSPAPPALSGFCTRCASPLGGRHAARAAPAAWPRPVCPSGGRAEPAGLSHVPSSLSASASSVLPTTRPLRFRWRARRGAWPAPTHLERSAAGQRPRGNTSRRLPRTTWDANTVPPPETADSNGIRLPAVWAPRTFTEKDPALAVCSALSFP